MKSIRIEFIPANEWRIAWGCAAFVIGALLVGSAWHLNATNAQAQLADAELEKLQQFLSSNNSQIKSSAYSSSAAQAAKVLQHDLNKVFSGLESLTIPGARLKSIQLDVASNTVRIEFELDSIATSDLVSNHLNSGYSAPPWRIASITSAGGNRVISNVIGDTRPLTGIWIGTYSLL